METQALLDLFTDFGTCISFYVSDGTNVVDTMWLENWNNKIVLYRQYVGEKKAFIVREFVHDNFNEIEKKIVERNVERWNIALRYIFGK